MEQKIEVSWGDLNWAASNHWLDKNSLAIFADRLSTKSEALQLELAAISMNKDEVALRALINREARRSTSSEEAARERWMLIAVAWLYQNREIFDDPWLAIEDLWSAFGHPPALNGLIKWMPVPPGAEVGEEAMLKRWRTMANSI